MGEPAIVNPAKASAEGRTRVCGQCHSNHQESPLPRTDPFWLRFQGTTITWSRCYTESAGTFDCMTCHDPHHDNDRSASTLQRAMPHLPFRPNHASRTWLVPTTSNRTTERRFSPIDLPGQSSRWLHRLPHAVDP